MSTRGHARTWLLTFLGLILIAVLAEQYWRSHGHEPSITDSKVFWAMHRARVYAEDGRRKLVIVGDSRSQLGLAPAAFRDEFPGYDVVHLAIDGTPSYEVLRDLCYDTLFIGIIVFGTTPTFRRAQEGDTRRDLEYALYYQGPYRGWASLDERINTWIGSSLQARFAQLSSGLSARRILMSGFRPQPLYAAMGPDRYRPAYYRTRMTPRELREHREARLSTVRSRAGARVSFAEFENHVRGDLQEAYKALRSRGGNLALVQLPTTGEHWTIDSATAPKSMFWDRITPWTGIATVHFKDYPGLSAFDCPDASHLDGEDAPEFTRRLAHILRPLLATASTQ